MRNLWIRAHNGLLTLADWLEERGHNRATQRVLTFRRRMSATECAIFGHTLVFGPSRDICLDCLTIVDEHPNGRGRG